MMMFSGRWPALKPGTFRFLPSILMAAARRFSTAAAGNSPSISTIEPGSLLVFKLIDSVLYSFLSMVEHAIPFCIKSKTPARDHVGVLEWVSSQLIKERYQHLCHSCWLRWRRSRWRRVRPIGFGFQCLTAFRPCRRTGLSVAYRHSAMTRNNISLRSPGQESLLWFRSKVPLCRLNLVFGVASGLSFPASWGCKSMNFCRDYCLSDCWSPYYCWLVNKELV